MSSVLVDEATSARRGLSGLSAKFFFGGGNAFGRRALNYY